MCRGIPLATDVRLGNPRYMGAGNPLAALALAGPLAGRTREQSVPEPGPGAHVQVFLAEHYLPGLDEQRVEQLAERLRIAASLRGGDRVRFLGSAGVPGDDSLLSIFSASSLEAVARTVRSAEVAADRIVPVVWRAGEG